MLIRGDARRLPLREGSVHCVVTSPPYFGLRDYGVAGQLGLESTPDAYIAALVGVFREVWRVLRHDGTVWLNLGDSYANDTKWGGASSGKHITALHGNSGIGRRRHMTGLKSKDLMGIPWRVAFALQADGWYLRSDIIWAKPNPMPESVTDRPTKAHEYVFLLAKNERYHYNADAIREMYAPDSVARTQRGGPTGRAADHKYANGGPGGQTLARNVSHGCTSPLGRNKRTVWTINTMPYAGAHFATMPEALVEPCILAGCPAGGLVLDPFVGSGTVVSVAQRMDRRGVGVDLTYQELARVRTAQRGLAFTAV